MRNLRIITIIIGIGALVLLMWPSLVVAAKALIPQGGEFIVNTTTVGFQQSFTAGTDSAGNFTSAWLNPVTLDCDSQDIYYQQFDSNGNKIGGERVAPKYLIEGQYHPNLAMNASGNFVIVWDEGSDISIGPCLPTNPDGSSRGVYAQRFSANGSANGAIFQVNTTWLGGQDWPVAAINNIGQFVIAWQDEAGNDGNGIGVYSQLFDSSGNKIGTEHLVNQTTTGDEWGPDVSINDSGEWVVVWISPSGIFARRFDSTSNPIEGEWQIDTFVNSANPRVKLFNDGTFVISWSNWVSGSDADTYFQRFNSSGTSLGPKILAHPPSTDRQLNADIDGDNITKSFFIVWSDNDSNNIGVAGRLFDWSGSSLSNPLQINTTQNGLQYVNYPGVIAYSQSGKIIVVWDDLSGNDGNQGGGFGQRYQVVDLGPIPLTTTYGKVALALFLALILFWISAKMVNRFTS